MKLICYIVCLSLSISVMAQDDNNEDKAQLYKDYREDQFYVGVTYNVLINRPADVTQSGFSPGIQLGFLRDMPINKQRNLAVALGLGLSFNSYQHNIYISEAESGYNYELATNIANNVTTNKLTTYGIEIPLELRWRTSTPTEYSFWRIYAGFKLGYVLHDRYRFKADGFDELLTQIKDFNTLEYGLTLSAGYGTWNFHVYYGLNPLFSSAAQLNANALDMSQLKLGLMFYIL